MNQVDGKKTTSFENLMPVELSLSTQCKHNVVSNNFLHFILKFQSI